MKLSYVIYSQTYLVLFMVLLGRPIYCSWQDPILPKLITDKLPEDRVIKFTKNKTAMEYYRLLLSDGNHLLIGAKNILYNISIATLELKKSLQWKTSEKKIKFCKITGNSEEECQNFIRVIVKISDDNILVCGTNAFKPACRNYKQDGKSYKMIGNETDGTAKCPFNPNHNSTTTYADGKLYSATFGDRMGTYPLIYKDIGVKAIKTERGNTFHLNEPNFIGSFHHDEYVYFFFREIIIEHINCEKTISSRISRVCTKDMGDSSSEPKWTSFLKASLNCSIPGIHPFYFNEIQSATQFVQGTYKVKNEVLYAVFTTAPNSITGSAVCAYSLKDIQKSFEGKFKVQKTLHSNWLAEDPKLTVRPGSCVNDSKSLPIDTLHYINKFNLMDESVPAFWGQPVVLYIGRNSRLTQIAIDPQKEAIDGKKYDVLFIGTDDGKVIKAINAGNANLINKTIPIIIEEIQVFKSKNPVVNLFVSKNRLIVVSNDEVLSIPINDCENRAKKCRNCVGIQDPYCAWDKINYICTSIDSTSKSKDQFVQNIEMGSDPYCPGGHETLAYSIKFSSTILITSIFLTFLLSLIVGIVSGYVLSQYWPFPNINRIFYKTPKEKKSELEQENKHETQEEFSDIDKTTLEQQK